MDSKFAHGEDCRKLTDEQKKELELLIKSSPAMIQTKEKKPLAYRVGELFASLMAGCVSLLLIALTIKLVSMILF